MKKLEFKHWHISIEDSDMRIISDLYQEIPTVPMSGLVSLHKTYEQILQRLRFQGFFFPGTSSAYSCDLELEKLTKCTGTRLMTYPDIDFACYTNHECNQCECLFTFI
jgi:hypothetical protein